MKRRDALQLGGIVVGGSLAGCTSFGNSGKQEASGSDGNPTLKYAGASSGALGVITQTLLDQKFDKKHDLNLDTKLMSIPSAQKAIVNKQFDVGPVPPLTAADINNRGEHLQSIRPLCKIQESLIVKKSVEGKSLKDLKGMKLGSLPQSSSLYHIFEMILDMKNMKSEDFQYQFGSTAVLIGLLLKGEIDASLMVDPVTAKLTADKGFKEILYYDTAWQQLTGKTIPVIDIGAWKPTVDKNPEAIKRLNLAFDDAGKYVAEHSEDVMRKYKKDLNLESDAEIKLAAKRMKDLYPSAFSQDLREGERDLVTRAAAAGILEKKPNLDDVFVDPTKL